MPIEKQLKLLSIFHYVVGGIMALFWCFPLIHFGIGFYMTFFADKPAANSHPPPAWFGLLFMLVGGALFLMGQAMAWCAIAAGRFIAQRRRYLFVFVVACVECMFTPFGTILGVFTIILLSKDHVKALFGDASAGPAPERAPAL